MKKIIALVTALSFMMGNISFAYEAVHLAPPLMLDDIAQNTALAKPYAIARIGLEEAVIENRELVKSVTDVNILRKCFQFVEKDRRTQNRPLQEHTVFNPANITICHNQLEKVYESWFMVPVIVEKNSKRDTYWLLFSTELDDAEGFPVLPPTREELKSLRRGKLPGSFSTSENTHRAAIDRFVQHRNDVFDYTLDSKGNVVHITYYDSHLRQVVDPFEGKGVDRLIANDTHVFGIATAANRAYILDLQTGELGNLYDSVGNPAEFLPNEEASREASSKVFPYYRLINASLDQETVTLVFDRKTHDPVSKPSAEKFSDIIVITYDVKTGREVARKVHANIFPEEISEYSFGAVHPRNPMTGKFIEKPGMSPDMTETAPATSYYNQLKAAERAYIDILIEEAFKKSGNSLEEVRQTLAGARLGKITATELSHILRMDIGLANALLIRAQETLAMAAPEEPARGKSPADALKVIALMPSFQNRTFAFTLTEFYQVYVVVMEGLGLERPAENWKEPFSNVLEGLCKVGILKVNIAMAPVTYSIKEDFIKAQLSAIEEIWLGYNEKKDSVARALKKAYPGDKALPRADGEISVFRSELRVAVDTIISQIMVEATSQAQQSPLEKAGDAVIPSFVATEPEFVDDAALRATSARELLEKARAAVPEEYANAGLDGKILLQEFEKIGVTTITQIDADTLNVFSEKITFTTGFGVYLEQLAAVGIRVAVVVSNESERTLIDMVNESLTKERRIVYGACADDIINSNTLARAYYYKFEDEPSASAKNVINVPLTKQQIMRLLGRISGIVKEAELEIFREAAKLFSQAA